MALDPTRAGGGTIEYVPGSHRWPVADRIRQFHAPQNYREALDGAAADLGVENYSVVPLEVEAGDAVFHHGRTWHGSGANQSPNPRRSLVLHAMPSDVEYVPDCFDQGIGPIYSRYKRLGDNQLDENYFPILWREDGYRTPQIDDFLNGI